VTSLINSSWKGGNACIEWRWITPIIKGLPDEVGVLIKRLSQPTFWRFR